MFPKSTPPTLALQDQYMPKVPNYQHKIKLLHVLKNYPHMHQNTYGDKNSKSQSIKTNLLSQLQQVSQLAIT